MPIAYSVRAYPAQDLILVRLSGTVDGNQLEAAMIAQARASDAVGMLGVWDMLGVQHLDLTPSAFEHLLHSSARTVRLLRPGAQAIVATDLVPLSIAHLIRRRARRFGMRVEVAPTVDAACRMLHVPGQALSDASAIRAASAGAS